jgi:hypothetical protein
MPLFLFDNRLTKTGVHNRLFSNTQEPETEALVVRKEKSKLKPGFGL